MQSCILLSPEGIGLPLMLHGDKFVNDPDLMETGVEVLLYWITALPGLERDGDVAVSRTCDVANWIQGESSAVQEDPGGRRTN